MNVLIKYKSNIIDGRERIALFIVERVEKRDLRNVEGILINE